MEHSVAFLSFVVKQLVDNPDAVQTEVKEDERGVLITLSVDPSDMGKVIGKNGATIQSLRNLLRLVGTKEKKKIMLKVLDPENE